MKISNMILVRIKTDLTFRLGLAAAMGISERQVTNLAVNTEKGVSQRLRDYSAITYFKNMGYAEDQIFQKETADEHAG